MMVRQVFSIPSARRAALALGALMLLSPVPSAAQQPDNPQCLALFQNYDLQVRVHGTTDPQQHGRSARPAVAAAASQLRSGGCLTFSAGLAGMTAVVLKTGAPAAGGAPISPPIYLHAGIVTTSGDDANAIAFFESHGFAARSVGAALLGRRIYVGPFASRAALDSARALALQAGFAYPYPAQF